MKPSISKNNPKQQIRNRIKSLLQLQNPFENEQLQNQFNNHLKGYLKSQSGCWAGFRPMKSEPQWLSICEELPNLTWAFPKIEGPSLKIYKNVKSFKKGPLQILEPADGDLVLVDQLQGCLFPGLAFSSKGTRLGHGAGYYDRGLENFQGTRVGLCFAIQFLETEIPSEAHDIEMNYVVTENGFYKVA